MEASKLAAFLCLRSEVNRFSIDDFNPTGLQAAIALSLDVVSCPALHPSRPP